MKSPITIVIPAYNRSATLKRTLDSVAKQRVKPAKVVLVDNNSTDDTLSIMHSWAKTVANEFEVAVLVEEKKGACAARNRGLKEVDTEFVMFFDSDDVMHENHVGDFTSSIIENPETDIFGRSIITNLLDGSARILYFTDRNPMFNHLFRACMSTQRIIVRADLVRAVGGWNENLPAWNDYELGVRLLLATDRIHNLSGEPSATTFQQEDSLTGTSFSARPEHWEKALDCIEQEFKKSGREDLLKWVDARRMILAAQYARESCGNREESFRENAEKQSERLKKQVLSHVSTPFRMKLVFLHNYYFNRLTWMLCKIIL